MEAPPLERKLAAILAADFEGYSRLMHNDEERTLATLTSHREIVDKLIDSAHGQIFGTAGDSVLAEFPSVVGAYYCAIAIQRALAKANAVLDSEHAMNLRIGINVGDVMVKEDNIFGDGVNIAARLEALADPGGICVTRGVRDHLRDRAQIDFEDLGEQCVKNIRRPVRVFRAIFDPLNTEPLPEFLRNIPDDEIVEPVETADDTASEVAFWQSAEASGDQAEYRLYLDRYPEGTFAGLAQARLDGTSAVEDPQVQVVFWETVRTSNDPTMINAYIKKYPSGEFRTLAEIMLSKFQLPST